MIRMMLLAVLAALTVVVAPFAHAQTAGADLTFSPAQRITIHKWIKRQPPTADRGLSVGAMLPYDVESYPVPKDWGRSAARYRYVHSGKRVYLVEPNSGKVVLRVD